ncbi:MAG: bifunctional enoyl-CoA hydratase/phosphate acetyltransferase [Alphaproteobacteria bacterium]|jgi:phosphate butyryltransferase|nr:bifunctional enoyl-CoA hydratase/phosphate acetyltransferase [Alphaproteobacteria bacterium]
MSHPNFLYDEIELGQEASIERVLTTNDLIVFAHASGNLNPIHLPELDGDGDGRPEAVAPSMWVGSLFSAVIGNILPGIGSLYLGQNLRFHGRVTIGDAITARVRVREKRRERVIVLDCRCELENGTLIADGEAQVIAPARKVELPDHQLPELMIERHQHFDRLLAACDDVEPITTAVAVPEDDASLGGALLAWHEGLITPILVGDRGRIEEVARALDADLGGVEIVDVADHVAAAARTVALVNDGRAAAIMKGHLHTGELLAEVTKRDGGLRSSRRLSHVFVMDVPGLPHPLLVTDAGINIAPDLEAKVDIVQNAIDLARALGMDTPRVGVLSAVETVNTKIPSTVDAAVLSKMADRGQIKGGVVDGPLAMDNAIDLQAAQTKGLVSLVAGKAQVLVAPNLEAGNMMAKELTFIAHAAAAGLVLGARVPIMLTSRADDEKSRLVSCALAQLYDAWKRSGRSVVRAREEG